MQPAMSDPAPAARRRTSGRGSKKPAAYAPTEGLRDWSTKSATHFKADDEHGDTTPQHSGAAHAKRGADGGAAAQAAATAAPTQASPAAHAASVTLVCVGVCAAAAVAVGVVVVEGLH